MQQLNQQLGLQYLTVIFEIQKAFKKFSDLEKMAFDYNVNVAFTGSYKLALEVGVDQNKILKSISDIDTYFMV